MTIVVNFIGGPGVGKTTAACLCFAKLKMANQNCEYVSEYAKDLVWQNRLNELNNQYSVSFRQYQKLIALKGKVDYIITDGSLFNDLYYNRYNQHNVSDVDKTEKQILDWASEFKHINIFLERNLELSYESAGRIQTLEEAIKISHILKYMLNEFNIPYQAYTIQQGFEDEILKLILDKNLR